MRISNFWFQISFYLWVYCIKILVFRCQRSQDSFSNNFYSPCLCRLKSIITPKLFLKIPWTYVHNSRVVTIQVKIQGSYEWQVYSRVYKLVENSTIQTITIPCRYFHNLKAIVSFFSEITRLQLRFFAFCHQIQVQKGRKMLAFSWRLAV